MVLPQFMRRKDGTPVEVLAQGKSFSTDGYGIASVLYMYHNNGRDHTAFAHEDGTNPRMVPSSDLVEYDIAACANHVQTGLDLPVFTAFRNLWKAGYHTEVVAAAIKDTGIHRSDMRHYLNGLWG